MQQSDRNNSSSSGNFSPLPLSFDQPLTSSSTSLLPLSLIPSSHQPTQYPPSLWNTYSLSSPNSSLYSQHLPFPFSLRNQPFVQAVHLYKPTNKSEVRLVYRFVSPNDSSVSVRHQKSYSFSKYGETIAWHLAKQAWHYINQTGELPPNFYNSSDTSISVGSGSPHSCNRPLNFCSEVQPIVAGLSDAAKSPREEAVSKLIPTTSPPSNTFPWQIQQNFPKNSLSCAKMTSTAKQSKNEPVSQNTTTTQSDSFIASLHRTANDLQSSPPSPSPLPNLLFVSRHEGFNTHDAQKRLPGRLCTSRTAELKEGQCIQYDNRAGEIGATPEYSRPPMHSSYQGPRAIRSKRHIDGSSIDALDVNATEQNSAVGLEDNSSQTPLVEIELVSCLDAETENDSNIAYPSLAQLQSLSCVMGLPSPGKERFDKHEKKAPDAYKPNTHSLMETKEDTDEKNSNENERYPPHSPQMQEAKDRVRRLTLVYEVLNDDEIKDKAANTPKSRARKVGRPKRQHMGIKLAVGKEHQNHDETGVKGYKKRKRENEQDSQNNNNGSSGTLNEKDISYGGSDYERIRHPPTRTRKQLLDTESKFKKKFKDAGQKSQRPTPLSPELLSTSLPCEIKIDENPYRRCYRPSKRRRANHDDSSTPLSAESAVVTPSAVDIEYLRKYSDVCLNFCINYLGLEPSQVSMALEDSRYPVTCSRRLTPLTTENSSIVSRFETWLKSSSPYGLKPKAKAQANSERLIEPPVTRSRSRRENSKPFARVDPTTSSILWTDRTQITRSDKGSIHSERDESDDELKLQSDAATSEVSAVKQAEKKMSALSMPLHESCRPSTTCRSNMATSISQSTSESEELEFEDDLVYMCTVLGNAAEAVEKMKPSEKDAVIFGGSWDFDNIWSNLSNTYDYDISDNISSGEDEICDECDIPKKKTTLRSILRKLSEEPSFTFESGNSMACGEATHHDWLRRLNKASQVGQISFGQLPIACNNTISSFLSCSDDGCISTDDHLTSDPLQALVQFLNSHLFSKVLIEETEIPTAIKRLASYDQLPQRYKLITSLTGEVEAQLKKHQKRRIAEDTIPILSPRSLLKTTPIRTRTAAKYSTITPSSIHIGGCRRNQTDRTHKSLDQRSILTSYTKAPISPSIFTSTVATASSESLNSTEVLGENLVGEELKKRLCSISLDEMFMLQQSQNPRRCGNLNQQSDSIAMSKKTWKGSRQLEKWKKTKRNKKESVAKVVVPNITPDFTARDDTKEIYSIMDLQSKQKPPNRKKITCIANWEEVKSQSSTLQAATPHRLMTPAAFRLRPHLRSQSDEQMSQNQQSRVTASSDDHPEGSSGEITNDCSIGMEYKQQSGKNISGRHEGLMTTATIPRIMNTSIVGRPQQRSPTLIAAMPLPLPPPRALAYNHNLSPSSFHPIFHNHFPPHFLSNNTTGIHHEQYQCWQTTRTTHPPLAHSIDRTGIRYRFMSNNPLSHARPEHMPILADANRISALPSINQSPLSSNGTSPRSHSVNDRANEPSGNSPQHFNYLPFYTTTVADLDSLNICKPYTVKACPVEQISPAVSEQSVQDHCQRIVYQPLPWPPISNPRFRQTNEYLQKHVKRVASYRGPQNNYQALPEIKKESEGTESFIDDKGNKSHPEVKQWNSYLEAAIEKESSSIFIEQQKSSLSSIVVELDNSDNEPDIIRVKKETSINSQFPAENKITAGDGKIEDITTQQPKKDEQGSDQPQKKKQKTFRENQRTFDSRKRQQLKVSGSSARLYPLQLADPPATYQSQHPHLRTFPYVCTQKTDYPQASQYHQLPYQQQQSPCAISTSTQLTDSDITTCAKEQSFSKPLQLAHQTIQNEACNTIASSKEGFKTLSNYLVSTHSPNSTPSSLTSRSEMKKMKSKASSSVKQQPTSLIDPRVEQMQNTTNVCHYDGNHQDIKNTVSTAPTPATYLFSTNQHERSFLSATPTISGTTSLPFDFTTEQSFSTSTDKSKRSSSKVNVNDHGEDCRETDAKKCKKLLKSKKQVQYEKDTMVGKIGQYEDKENMMNDINKSSCHKTRTSHTSRKSKAPIRDPSVEFLASTVLESPFDHCRRQQSYTTNSLSTTSSKPAPSSGFF